MYQAIFVVALSAFSLILSGCQSIGVKEESLQTQSVDAVADLQTKLGTGYMQEGQLDLAWEKLSKALAADPRYSVAHNAMALLYERLGKPENARTHYELAIRYNPNDSSAYTNYGSFLCRRGEFDDAEQNFQQALKNPLYQTPEIPITNLGLCLHQEGQKDLAENYLRRALELNPKIANALIVMSDLSLQNGQELSARAYIERYAEVRNHSPRTLWLGVQIERALGDLNAAASYAMLLRSNYPDSQETRLLLESESQWQ